MTSFTQLLWGSLARYRSSWKNYMSSLICKNRRIFTVLLWAVSYTHLSPDTGVSEDLTGVEFINGSRPGNPQLVEPVSYTHLARLLAISIMRLRWRNKTSPPSLSSSTPWRSGRMTRSSKTPWTWCLDVYKRQDWDRYRAWQLHVRRGSKSIRSDW